MRDLPASSSSSNTSSEKLRTDLDDSPRSSLLIISSSVAGWLEESSANSPLLPPPSSSSTWLEREEPFLRCNPNIDDLRLGQRNALLPFRLPGSDDRRCGFLLDDNIDDDDGPPDSLDVLRW